MRKIKYIVIHCSATPEGKDIDAQTIKDWHLKRKWRDIGYHYVIKLNGVIEDGRPELQIGAGVQGYNKHAIHICYVGGCDENMKPKDTRTLQQDLTMVNLVQTLKEKYPNAKVLGHRDFPNVAKACPSFDAIKEYGNV